MVKLLWFRLQHCFGLFTMLLVESPLKWDFSNIYLTTFSRVCKFKNNSAIRVIFLFKMFKIESSFPKCNKKFGKCFFVSEIFAPEDVAINCLY